MHFTSLGAASCVPAYAQNGSRLLAGRKFGIGDRAASSAGGGVKFKLSGEFVARQRRKQVAPSISDFNTKLVSNNCYFVNR